MVKGSLKWPPGQASNGRGTWAGGGGTLIIGGRQMSTLWDSGALRGLHGCMLFLEMEVLGTELQSQAINHLLARDFGRWFSFLYLGFLNYTWG